MADLAFLLAVTPFVTIGWAVLCVFLRFYTRFKFKGGIALDDWSILFGLVVLLIFYGIWIWALRISVGLFTEVAEARLEHVSIETLDVSKHTTYLKLLFVQPILYYVAITSIKISILLLYHRLFSSLPSFHAQILVMGTIVACFFVAFLTATLFSCIPFQYNWTQLSSIEHCFNYNFFWMVSGTVDVLIDLLILLLPIRVVMQLQISRRKKMPILLLFFLGSFVVITGIIRIIYSFGPGSRFGSGTASFWGITPGFWAAIHVDTAIICACLPPLKPLFSRLSSCASRRHPDATLLPQASPKVSPRVAGTRFSTPDRTSSPLGPATADDLPLGRLSATLQPLNLNGQYLEPLSFEGDYRTNESSNFMDHV